MPLPFLDPKNEEQNKFVLAITRGEIVRSAITHGLILDDDLAMVPEVMPIHLRLVGTLRDDLYRHHTQINKGLQFPLIANCFGYSFAKGAETAALWHASPSGKFDFIYRFDDAIHGIAGADVSQEFAAFITTGMLSAYDVFVDFQNKILAEPSLGLHRGDRSTADAIACGFFWASQVGLDAGMNRLGFP